MTREWVSLFRRVLASQGTPRQKRMSKMLLPIKLHSAMFPKPRKKNRLELCFHVSLLLHYCYKFSIDVVNEIKK